MIPTYSTWLEKGQVLESAGNHQEAVAAYDHALALLSEQPRMGAFRPLAIVWMNRGNALQKLGHAAAWVDALTSYGETIALLERVLPFDRSMVDTLGCAHMNRAGVLQKLARLPEAAVACDAAIETLSSPSPALDSHGALMLAAAWMNRGSIALDALTPDAAVQALSCARTALSLIAPRETSDLLAAEIGLKARQLFCQAAGQRLTHKPLAVPVLSTVGEASDCAETALTLVVGWRTGNVHGFESFGRWFFRFAASLYAEYQPHFLSEFVTEYVGVLRRSGAPPAGEGWRDSAVESLRRARVRIHSLLFSDPSAADAARWLETLRELNATETGLALLDR